MTGIDIAKNYCSKSRSFADKRLALGCMRAADSSCQCRERQFNNPVFPRKQRAPKNREIDNPDVAHRITLKYQAVRSVDDVWQRSQHKIPEYYPGEDENIPLNIDSSRQRCL